MNFIKTYILPVLSGFVVASIVMMLFETVNSFLFPFPQGFNTHDGAAVRAFAAQFSPQIFYLVLIGWTVGAYVGGYVTAWLSGEARFRHGAVLAVLLVLAGILNYFIVHSPLWFNLVAFPALGLGTYLGHKYRTAKGQ